MTNALEYLKEAGHCTDKSYPYTATDSECQKCEAVVKIGGYQVSYRFLVILSSLWLIVSIYPHPHQTLVFPDFS